MPLLAKTPEELFDYGTPDEIKAQYRKLAGQHHPDKGGDAADFQLVKDLYDQALAKIESGAPWDTGKAVTWRVGDRSFTLKYRRRLDAGIGKAYAGQTRVLFLLDESFADLGKDAYRLMLENRANAGPNDRLKEVNGWILPDPVSDPRGDAAIMLSKDEDIHPLRAVLEAYPKIDAASAAWMIGRLMHILCFLEWKGVVHGDLSVDSLFVNLKNHSLHLYGGWWFSRAKGTRFAALPARSIRLCPSDIIKEKVAHKRLDFELARHAACEIMGAASPTELRMRKDIPAPLVQFLVSPFAAPTATELYNQWEKTRDASFAKREFVHFDHDPRVIYQEK